MPYADRDRQRQYVREWMARRRAEWLAANGPCVWCGSAESLEVDHIDPALKVTHSVWSWAKVRRDVELAKCRVLCRSCHRERTNQQMRKPPDHGTWQCYSRKCRDPRCRRAWAVYQATVRARRSRIAA